MLLIKPSIVRKMILLSSTDCYSRRCVIEWSFLLSNWLGFLSCVFLFLSLSLESKSKDRTLISLSVLSIGHDDRSRDGSLIGLSNGLSFGYRAASRICIQLANAPRSRHHNHRRLTTVRRPDRTTNPAAQQFPSSSPAKRKRKRDRDREKETERKREEQAEHSKRNQ